jgi:hypothetical protein
VTTARRLARRVARQIGHRGAALSFFALLDAVYAYSLFNPPPHDRQSAQLALARDVLPLWAWGALWAAAGAACAFHALRERDRLGFAAAMAIKVLWGGLYVYGACIGVERAYLSAAIWLCLAAWVYIISSWPEPMPLDPTEPASDTTSDGGADQRDVA